MRRKKWIILIKNICLTLMTMMIFRPNKDNNHKTYQFTTLYMIKKYFLDFNLCVDGRQ